MLKFGGVGCQPPGLGLPDERMFTAVRCNSPLSKLCSVISPGLTGMLWMPIVGTNASPSRSNFVYQAL